MLLMIKVSIILQIHSPIISKKLTNTLFHSFTFIHWQEFGTMAKKFFLMMPVDTQIIPSSLSLVAIYKASSYAESLDFTD